MVEQVFIELPPLCVDLHQSLDNEAMILMCSILVKRKLDGLFNGEYWYEYTGTEKQVIMRKTAILTAFSFMDNTLDLKELRHYTREILLRLAGYSVGTARELELTGRIQKPAERLYDFKDEDIDNIRRTYRELYYPLNFFRSAVRELGNEEHWDLNYEEKKLLKSYEMKSLNYNYHNKQWYEQSLAPQTMYGTGPHAIININWKNYDFGK